MMNRCVIKDANWSLICKDVFGIVTQQLGPRPTAVVRSQRNVGRHAKARQGVIRVKVQHQEVVGHQLSTHQVQDVVVGDGNAVDQGVDQGSSCGPRVSFKVVDVHVLHGLAPGPPATRTHHLVITKLAAGQASPGHGHGVASGPDLPDRVVEPDVVLKVLALKTAQKQHLVRADLDQGVEPRIVGQVWTLVPLVFQEQLGFVMLT